MIEISKNFINNKKVYIWIILLIILMYNVYEFFDVQINNYKFFNHIENDIYNLYVYLLPISFHHVNFVLCICMDLSFLAILLYISVSFVNLFFNECSTTTITRISREKWIKDFVNINLIFSLIICGIYVLMFYIFGTISGYNINPGFSLANILPIVYKICISCIISIIYMYYYIKTNDLGISLGFSLFTNILLQIIIRITYVPNDFTFNNCFLVLFLLLILYLLIRVLIIKSFKRRDI